jgi:hypothetical protein
MLYVAVLWGASDFYNFGSNLMGSTLRQDWLVALGLGACAIKKERYALGGVLMAYGGLIRAFPAMATFFFLVPMAWFAFDAWWSRRKLPTKAEWRWSAPGLARVHRRRDLRGRAGRRDLGHVRIQGLVDRVEREDRNSRHRSQHQQRRASQRAGLQPQPVGQGLMEHRRPGPWDDWGTAPSA